MSLPREVRAPLRSDLAAMAAIVDGTELFPPEMLADMIAPFLDGSAPHIWLVAEADGAAQAFVYCEPERMTDGTWNMLALGVHPDWQGRGLGAAVVQALEAQLRGGGARLVLVETLGTPEFDRTRAFYGRQGYEREACIRDFYEAGGDKVVYRKAL